MPIESELLKDAPYPDVACPKCGEYPLVPFMRGLVQRRKWTIVIEWDVFYKWGYAFKCPFIRRKDRHYCSIICSNCQEMVGFESPSEEDRERNRKKFYKRPAKEPPCVIYVDLEGRDQVQKAALSSMAAPTITSSVADMTIDHPEGCMCWGCRQNRIDSRY